MNHDQMLDHVARAIHKADETHGHEPYEPSAERYLDMAFAAIEAYDEAKDITQ